MISDNTRPTTQKAWIVVKQGKPRDALVLKMGLPIPKPERGEVLVRVHAVALNPVGWKMMAVMPNWLTKRPHPAEHDLAGVVVDANDTSFSNGDEIFGFIPVSMQQSTSRGALAQYIVVPEDHIMPKPKNLTLEESAGITLVGQTAIQGLRLGGYDPARPLSADVPNSILITGGSTSVGMIAIQLAKSLSIHVTATASPRNTEFVLGLGADEVLDYTAGPLAEQILVKGRMFGMVLDAASILDPGVYKRSGAYVKRGGAYVTTGLWPDKRGWINLMWHWAGPLLRPAWLGGVPTQWKFYRVANNKGDLKLLHAMIERGALRPHVDSTYEFNSALDAYDRLMTGRATGKVIIKVD